MRSEARAAQEGDVERVALLLHAASAERTLEAYRRAVRARIDESDGGTLLAGDATLSWVLDGGAVFLYDLLGAGQELEAVIELAERIAGERLAAVLAATLYDDDPMVEQLGALGFERDWSESDAFGGRIRTLIGLVRQVGGR